VPAPASADESLEAFLRRVREREQAVQTALRPRVERIVLGLESLAQPPDPKLLAALHAEIDELGGEAAPLLVPELDPGPEPSPQAAFRAGELVRALARTDTAAISAPLGELTRTGSALGRRNAIRCLAHASDAAAEARLHELFEGSDPELRRAAAVALAERRSPARAAFLQRALSEPDPELVGAVVAALAQAPDAEATDAIFSLLARPAAAAPWMERILQWLGAIAPLPEERLAALVDLALDGRLSSEARASLLEVVARAGSLPKQEERRLEALTRESDAVLREAALVCLARLGDRNARRELVRIYDELVSKNERWPTAYQKRADVLLEIGEPREASQDYRQAVDLVLAQGRRPAPELWLALARALLRDDRMRQAHDVLLEGRVGAADLAPLADDPDFRPLREHPRYGRVFTQ
jgi:hypothetical protein